MDSIEFGKYFETLRKKAGYDKQSDLAKESGVEASTISRIETGDTKNPNIETLRKVSPFLKVSPEQLMEAAGYIEIIVNAEYTQEELHFINRFRKLSPHSQQAVLTLIESLEQIDRAQKEQSANQEVG